MKRLFHGLICCGLWLGLGCSSAGAQPASPTPGAARPSADAFFKNPDVLDAQLSPSGKQLAITTAAGATRVALMVLDLDTPGKMTRAALFNDIDVVGFQWVNDKRLIFSVVDLELGSGEDRHNLPGLFGVDADGKNLRRLVARGWGPSVIDGLRTGRDALTWNHVLLHVPPLQAGSQADEVIVGEQVFHG